MPSISQPCAPRRPQLICWDWNLGRPCSSACAQHGFLHVCQGCRQPCEFGEGRHACKLCRSASCAGAEATSSDSLTKLELEIPNEGYLISFLVGKGGASIRSIQQETNCAIDIPQLRGRDATLAAVRRVTLQGRPAAVSAAEKALLERVRMYKARSQRGLVDIDAPTAESSALRTESAVDGSSSSGGVVDDDSALCVVCLDAPKTHLLLPCGHKCVCSGCALDYAKPAADGWQRVGRALCCPICRSEVSNVAKVWE